MRALGDAELNVIFGMLMVFVGLYLALAGWWRTPMGRHIMAFMLSATVTVGVRVSKTFLGEWSGYYTLRAMAFALVILTLGWRILLLIKAQIARYERRRQPAGEKEEQ